jgi:hypothetical protein
MLINEKAKSRLSGRQGSLVLKLHQALVRLRRYVPKSPRNEHHDEVRGIDSI